MVMLCRVRITFEDDLVIVTYAPKPRILEFRIGGSVQTVNIAGSISTQTRFTLFLHGVGTAISLTECRDHQDHLLHFVEPRRFSSIRHSILDASSSNTCAVPSLMIENDEIFLGFLESSRADSLGIGDTTFAVSSAAAQQSVTHSKWFIVGAISSSQRLYGVNTNSLDLPIRLRIQSDQGNATMFTVDATKRGVFGIHSDRLQIVDPHTVKHIAYDGWSATVLCGDGQAISGALCDRFRIRF